MSPATRRLALTLAAVLLVQLALVALVVSPRLSARLTGEEILLEVEPVDPIDPFRGAYVDLGYPTLRKIDNRTRRRGSDEDGSRGALYVVLARTGEVWEATNVSRTRPDEGRYLACDDRSFRIRCGIESWFLPQDRARAVEAWVEEGDALARIKVDGRGNAALVAVEER